MDIYPQDLGRRDYVRVLRLRALPNNGAEADALAVPDTLTPVPLTPLRRLWIRDSGIPEKTVQFAAPALKLDSATVPLTVCIGLTLAVFFITAIRESHWGLSLILLVLMLAAAYRTYVAAPRKSVRTLHRPLTEPEVARIRSVASDRLHDEFLALVQAAIPITPGGGGSIAPATLRTALRALASALDDLLPAEEAQSGDDPEALRANAAALDRKIATEADPVVVASIERRRQSLLRRADTVARIQTVRRRNEVLRREAGEQIKALQASLTATTIGQDQDAAEFADLAGNIQQVAVEANAITAARAEINAALAEDMLALTASETQSAGQRGQADK